MRTLRRVAVVGASFAAFIGVWALVVWIGDYPEYILPSPQAVAQRGAEAIANGTLQPHAATTLVESLIGFAVGATVAIGVGILLGKSHLAERVLSPYLVAAQAVPILALAPLIAIWFGGGLQSRVVICALIIFFPIVIATMVGIRSADPQLVEMLRAAGASPRQVTTLVEIPSALPVLFGGLRVGVTLAVIGAVVAECAGCSVGLGILINIANQGLFDTPLMFVALATLALMGLALYGGVLLVERAVVHR